MRYALTALFLLPAGALLAQGQPQMTWQGYVSGSATLYIHGNAVDAQARTTGGVDRPVSRFYSSLPARAQRVEVDVVRGDGRVLVSEQPSPSNEYTAIVRVDPHGTAHEYFKLNFYWDDGSSGIRSRQDRSERYRTRRPSRDVRGDQGQTDQFGPQYMTWTGRVDHEALIEVRGRRANARTVRGQRAVTDSVNFTAPLPQQQLDVALEDAEGRGEVELVQEPDDRNNYTAVIRVTDGEAGAGTYSFRLAWEGDRYSDRVVTRGRTIDGTTRRTGSYSGVLSPSGAASANDSPYGSGDSRLIWTGRVDGTVQLVFRGDRVTVNRMSGSPVTDDRLQLGSPLPTTRLRTFDVNKLEGRGDVRVVAEPSSYNNYALTVEISDSEAGADSYGIEVRWER